MIFVDEEGRELDPETVMMMMGKKVSWVKMVQCIIKKMMI